MSNILLPGGYDEIKLRIQNLNANHQRKWGKMNVHQMLLHCIDAVRMTLGELQVAKKSNIFMRTLVKRFVLSDIKFPQSTPTAPELIKTGTAVTSTDIEKDKQTLLAYIDKLKNASESELKPHPAFGKMTKVQHGKLIYKHLDHHLRQFGA
ncbi:MAG: DUF1569 domain-containing protein [Bacteroidia bacterium]